jgi:hypothetical protein
VEDKGDGMRMGLKVDYLVDRGAGRIPVGDGSMKFVVNFITIAS